MKKTLQTIIDRTVSIVAFIFPFIEIVSYFGPKVFLGIESRALRGLYVNYLLNLSNFYTNNSLIIFIFMVWIFIACSRGSLPLSKFARFNIIQAILLNIICACIGMTFTYFPIVVRESLIGVAFANFLFLGTILLIAYASLLIIYGRFPSIPIISEAAKIQVQQGSD